MDEQHDLTVLAVEETETDADYDYLSILREMQEALSADEESSTIFASTGDEFGATAPQGFFNNQIFENASLTHLAENSCSSNNFTRISEDNAITDDLANAKTQPLPELSSELNDDLMAPELIANSADETDFVDASIYRDQDSLAAETTAENTIAVQSHDHLFNDFTEMSPILFDSGEQIDLAEPDFETESLAEITAGRAPSEIIAEITASAEALEGESETAVDELPEMGHEMPFNLTFGEMFAEDSAESPVITALAPPIEIDDETEAEFTSLLERLESNSPIADIAARLSETTAAEPNFESQDLVQNLSNNAAVTKSAETFEDAETVDFGLPEIMLLNERDNNVAPEPSFSMLDNVESESAVETIRETPLPAETETADFDDTALAVPSFLQAEIAVTKQLATQEAVPNSLFALETPADIAQETTLELRALANEMLVVSPPAEAGKAPFETLEADFSPSSVAFDEISFDDFKIANETQEMPETALFESLANEAGEIDYPDDFSTDYSTLLKNEFEDLPQPPETEMPESLLLDNFKPEMPEVDFAQFDLPSAPVVTNFDLPRAAGETLTATSNGILGGSRQESAARSLLQEISEIPKSVSFLKERFVIFKLDDTLYAFPAVNVAEIGQLLPITPLPFVPSWFLGISNLRGDILSVVGLRELWEKNAASPHKAKILVVHSEKQALTVGLVVDAVREMRHVTPEEIFSDDSTTETPFAPYQIGMVEYEGQNLCLLNAEKLLETLRG